jgi:hypothetical protein
MPENIVVTFKTEKPGGLWPFVRGCLAWIGFGAVAVGVSVLDSPNPHQRAVQIIEAVSEDWRAYEAAHHANPFGHAPDTGDYGHAPDDDPQ